MSGLNFGDAWDTDFFGNPKGGGGCLTSFIILFGTLTLIGCGVTKNIKILIHKDDKQKIEQIAKNTKTPANTVVYNNAKIR